MKCLLIIYINSEELTETIESIMDYQGFTIIENNTHYRVFSGDFKGHATKLADRLNTELDDANFHIDDSMFIVYPVNNDKGNYSISNIIIKKKGSRYLRKHQIK